jgi:hypothetical protein
MFRPDHQTHVAKTRRREVLDDQLEQCYSAGYRDQGLDARVGKTLLFGGQRRTGCGTHPRPEAAGQYHCFFGD